MAKLKERVKEIFRGDSDEEYLCPDLKVEFVEVSDDDDYLYPDIKVEFVELKPERTRKAKGKTVDKSKVKSLVERRNPYARVIRAFEVKGKTYALARRHDYTRKTLYCVVGNSVEPVLGKSRRKILAQL